MFIQQLINGLSVGSVYALMAVGYALIYSLLNFTNFAHSISVTIGAFATFFFLTYAMQDLLAGVIMGIVAAAALAAFIQFVAYRPLLKRNARRVYLMIIGLGISVMGDNLIIIAFSGRFRIYPVNFSSQSLEIFGASVGVVDVVIFVVSMLSLLVVELIIRKTRLGLAIRGASYSLETTSLMGVDTYRLILAIFLIAGALAGVAGALLGAKYTTYPSLGTFYTNKAFICAVFGGLGSLPGAVVGALVLGVSEAMISAYVSTTLRDLFAYILLIGILLIRPSGLMGKSSEDKA
ncbi:MULTISPECIES: branched-chain amino acid ABC transporter permease [Anaerotruncus]|uniref:branched-chain amino acid ABC transporter permease n=1 Tax=Anaerotruncus TaxID=244127 RepID=UPI00082F4FCF|nr:MULTISPECIES: branched-chain amino acid ABC transporter permease [Anaerotruncus]RGX56844.1 branched-chain amino acid ABC transporter permease [Anaerotruncus sp. AF02-27]